MEEFVHLWDSCLREQWALAAANLDFLCIHPFRDGNGRVSRLLFLLMAYRLGFEVGRYVSIERLIELQKERYYETLELSSIGWHEGGNDPWPYTGFVLSTLKSAYVEFEQRVAGMDSPRGSKTALVETAIQAKQGSFTLTALERDCPTVSRDLIRRVLGELRKKGIVESLGRGPGGGVAQKELIARKRVRERVIPGSKSHP